MWCKIKLHIFSKRATARCTTRPNAGEWALNFVQVNRYIQWQCEYSRALTKWLKHSTKDSNKMFDKERLAWQAISDRRSVIWTPCTLRHPECQAMSELDKWTLFFSSWNCCWSHLRTSHCEIRLRLRDPRGYGMCGNGIPGIYKHCNVSSDS